MTSGNPPGLSRAAHPTVASLEPAFIAQAIHAPGVLERLQRPVTIDCSHDVPYLAGYSRDAATIYFDRHLPLRLRIDGRLADIREPLAAHEKTEKALIDLRRMDYEHAHAIATVVEHALLRRRGIAPAAYEAALRPYIKSAESELVTRVPPDLDLTPYRDERDVRTLKRLGVR
jgi:hypothetical protein